MGKIERGGAGDQGFDRYRLVLTVRNGEHMDDIVVGQLLPRPWPDLSAAEMRQLCRRRLIHPVSRFNSETWSSLRAIPQDVNFWLDGWY